MTAFTDAINRNWPDYVITPGTSAECSECTCGEEIDPDDTEALQVYEEATFSWLECESCGSKLGGDRHNAHAIHREAFGPDAKQPDLFHHIHICSDCLMFHANSEEPDNWS